MATAVAMLIAVIIWVAVGDRLVGVDHALEL